MLRKKFVFVILITVLMLGFVFIGCDTVDEDNIPQTITYTGTTNSLIYTLKITQNINKRSIYLPVAGDYYELTFGIKKSNGTVLSFSNELFVLQPSDHEKVSFNAKILGNNISELTGTISWNDNTSDIGPGIISNNNGSEINSFEGYWIGDDGIEIEFIGNEFISYLDGNIYSYGTFIKTDKFITLNFIGEGTTPAEYGYEFISENMFILKDGSSTQGTYIKRIIK